MKINRVFICIGLLFITSGCLSSVSVQDDTNYSSSEIEAAKRVIENEADEMKKTCNFDITSLWVEENDKNSNEITVYSNLETYDYNGLEESCAFNPNSTYDRWQWILKRENKDAPWILIDLGYN